MWLLPKPNSDFRGARHLRSPGREAKFHYGYSFPEFVHKNKWPKMRILLQKIFHPIVFCVMMNFDDSLFLQKLFDPIMHCVTMNFVDSCLVSSLQGAMFHRVRSTPFLENFKCYNLASSQDDFYLIYLFIILWNCLFLFILLNIVHVFGSINLGRHWPQIA